jgi:hypothetical protein
MEDLEIREREREKEREREINREVLGNSILRS